MFWIKTLINQSVQPSFVSDIFLYFKYAYKVVLEIPNRALKSHSQYARDNGLSNDDANMQKEGSVAHVETRYADNHFNQFSTVITAAYGIKEFIENFNSIKYVIREIMKPLAPQRAIDYYDNLPATPESVKSITTNDITWIMTHFITNMIGLRFLSTVTGLSKICISSTLNTAFYTAKYYAYKESYKLIPQNIEPIETVTDFSQCWKTTLAGATLGALTSMSTRWTLKDRIDNIKIAVASGTGAFLHGYSCYEYSQQQYKYTQTKSYIEHWLPYIVDLIVGIHTINAMSKIPAPENSAMSKIMLIQKGVVALGSVVMTDIATKAAVSFIPDSIKQYTDYVIDSCVDSVKDWIVRAGYNLAGVTNDHEEL